MGRQGLLIDYEYCCGCHTCEVACQKEHGFDVGIWGIKVAQVGPFPIPDSKKVVYECYPCPTDLCDLCASRTEKGKDPTCVHHCQTGCMSFGDVDELADRFKEKPRQVLFMPR